LDTSRYEHILMRLIKEYVPTFFSDPYAPKTGQLNGPDRLPSLARRLSAYGILVLVGDVAANHPFAQDWMNIQVQFYAALADALYAPYSGYTTRFEDPQQPTVLTLVGKSRVTTQVMAGYVIPYVAARRGRPSSETERRGLMEIVLEELGADDLARADYVRLRGEGMRILQRWISQPVHQMALTDYDRVISDDSPTEQLVPFSTPIKPMPPQNNLDIGNLAQIEPTFSDLPLSPHDGHSAAPMHAPLPAKVQTGETPQIPLTTTPAAAQSAAQSAAAQSAAQSAAQPAAQQLSAQQLSAQQTPPLPPMTVPQTQPPPPPNTTTPMTAPPPPPTGVRAPIGGKTKGNPTIPVPKPNKDS
jgi:hypothetical protein